VRRVEPKNLSSAPSPGTLFRLSATVGAVAVGLVVASAVLELGATHWGLAAIALPLLVANTIVARWAYPELLLRAVASVALFSLAIALGGVVAWSDGATWASVLHVGAAGTALGASLLVVAAALRGAPPVPFASARDYLTLTKPRIMTLLLLTGAAGMFVGAQGVPPLGLFVVTMLGLALACGGASALNHVLDRDIDVLMGSRTKERPVASGRVTPEQALEFGVLLSALSFALLASANVLTAVLALVGNLFYVVVYTRWLKRSTPQNIVIGGAAGAVPPLVGYAAATGSLALPALWLFLIVFLWTPPHFWALALMIKKAYAAAGVPMLPVVRGDRETARQILLYSLALVAFTIAVGYWLGPLYTVAAVALGSAFIALAVLLRRNLSRARAQVLFHYSLAYLALLFVAAALDPVIL